MADRSWCQVRQPMGFRGRCRATTTPTAASETATAICALPVASGFCRAPSDSGISAAARSTVTPTSAHAVAGVAHPGRAPAGCASPTDATLRRHRSGNVTAEQASVRGCYPAGLGVVAGQAVGSFGIKILFVVGCDRMRRISVAALAAITVATDKPAYRSCCRCGSSPPCTSTWPGASR